MDSKQFIQIKREKIRKRIFKSMMSEKDMSWMIMKDEIENIVSKRNSQEIQANNMKEKEKKKKEEEIGKIYDK